MAPIRPFTSCRAQVPCVHKSFKTVSQLLENPYLYFCLANAGSPSRFACYPKAVRTGAPPKIKHRTPPPCVRPGSPPGLKFSLRPARPNGPFPFPGDGPKRAFAKKPSQRAFTIMARKRQSQSRNGAVAENRTHRSARVAAPAATPALWRKDTPANRHKDVQPALLSQLCVADLRFLEAIGVFTNQILNAVARIGAWKQSRFVHICNFIAFLPRIIYSVPFFDGIRLFHS